MIPTLEAMLPRFEGNTYKEAGKTDIVTQEGAAAVQELIDYLKKAPSVAKLRRLDAEAYKTTPVIGDAFTRPEGMVNACKDHVIDTGPTGVIGHTGTDNSSPFDRIEKYGTWETSAAENIAYGETTGLGVMLSLMIDDGVAGRGHRYNIMNPAFKVTGPYSGTHKTYGHQSCLTYAVGFTPKGSSGGGGDTGSTGSGTLTDTQYRTLDDEVFAEQNKLRADP